MTDKRDHNSTEQRIVRIETMLALLCHHLGLNPRTGQHLSKELTERAKRPDQNH